MLPAIKITVSGSNISLDVSHGRFLDVPHYSLLQSEDLWGTNQVLDLVMYDPSFSAVSRFGLRFMAKQTSGCSAFPGKCTLNTPDLDVIDDPVVSGYPYDKHMIGPCTPYVRAVS